MEITPELRRIFCQDFINYLQNGYLIANALMPAIEVKPPLKELVLYKGLLAAPIQTSTRGRNPEQSILQKYIEEKLNDEHTGTQLRSVAQQISAISNDPEALLRTYLKFVDDLEYIITRSDFGPSYTTTSGQSIPSYAYSAIKELRLIKEYAKENPRLQLTHPNEIIYRDENNHDKIIFINNY